MSHAGEIVAFMAFFVFFAGFWIGITVLLGLICGWPRLQERFPDRDEPASLLLRGQSGSLGPVVTGFMVALPSRLPPLAIGR